MQYVFLSQPKASGITILVEDQESFPIRKTGVFAQPGTYASIIVKKTVTTSLAEPYGNCVETDVIDTVLSRELKKLGLKYAHHNCMTLCEQKQNIDQLGCYSLRLPQIFNASACETRSQYDNLRNMTYNNSICTELCPFECKKTQYDLQISYAGFPSYNYYYDSINNNKSYWEDFFGKTDFEAFKYSLVPVSVYFDELTTTTIEESPALSIVDLVAYIGGTLGLFVGVSLLTFTEIMVLLVDLFLAIFDQQYPMRNNLIKVAPSGQTTT